MLPVYIQDSKVHKHVTSESYTTIIPKGIMDYMEYENHDILSWNIYTKNDKNMIFLEYYDKPYRLDLNKACGIKTMVVMHQKSYSVVVPIPILETLNLENDDRIDWKLYIVPRESTQQYMIRIEKDVLLSERYKKEREQRREYERIIEENIKF